MGREMMFVISDEDGNLKPTGTSYFTNALPATPGVGESFEYPPRDCQCLGCQIMRKIASDQERRMSES